MISNEYIQLKNVETGEMVNIKPFVEFESLPEGEYVNLNQARIMDKSFGKTLRVLSPGETIKELPLLKEEATDYSSYTKAELKQVLDDQGKSYGSKDTNSKLIELINA